MQGRLEEARAYYEKAYELANGENVRNQIEQLIENLSNGGDGEGSQSRSKSRVMTGMDAHGYNQEVDAFG